MKLRLEEVSLGDLVASPDIHEAWYRLALMTPGSSYFQTPDWVLSWWETIGGQPSGVAAMIWDGDDLCGLFPMARVREPVSKRVPMRVGFLTNAGSGIGTDHGGWIARTDGARDLLAEWTRSRVPAVLRGVPMQLGETVGGRLISTTRCPRLRIDDAEELISNKLAKTLRNARRRLDREGFSFQWKDPGRVSEGDLERLYDLHRMRREEAGDEPVFANSSRQAFHERLRTIQQGENGTAMMTAALDNQICGVLYGFVWRDTFSYYQIGWDPSHRKLSLGSVLVQEAIETSKSLGLVTFDFLRGPEDYKYRFGASDLVEGTFAVGRSFGLSLIQLAERIRAQESEDPE